MDDTIHRKQIALISTNRFREFHQPVFVNFVQENLEWLVNHTQVYCTGTTYENITKIVSDSNTWDAASKQSILQQIVRWPNQSKGIVKAANELIEGRLHAILHLSHYKDINSTLASSALKRQCLVHGVVYADSAQSATFIISEWKSNNQLLARLSSEPTSNIVPIQKLRENGRNNIALIAHDGKKLDLCLLAMQFLPALLKYDFILATGTTGGWLMKYLVAAVAHSNLGISEEDVRKKVICCESGPKGGDAQIAYIALEGLCNKIIFLIDPMAAHPHEPDIRFLEQVVELSSENTVMIATNVESAKYLLQ